MVPLCSVCGKNPASYVCRDCGRSVCGQCFDAVQWSCVECQKRRDGNPHPLVTSSANPALYLLFVAVGMIFVGIFLLMISSSLNGISGGGVILIGPIPILIGTGTNSTSLILIGAVVTIFTLIFFGFVSRRGH
jgi:uncharacterized membrane protein